MAKQEDSRPDACSSRAPWPQQKPSSEKGPLGSSEHPLIILFYCIDLCEIFI